MPKSMVGAERVWMTGGEATKSLLTPCHPVLFPPQLLFLLQVVPICWDEDEGTGEETAGNKKENKH